MKTRNAQSICLFVTLSLMSVEVVVEQTPNVLILTHFATILSIIWMETAKNVQTTHNVTTCCHFVITSITVAKENAKEIMSVVLEINIATSNMEFAKTFPAM